MDGEEKGLRLYNFCFCVRIGSVISEEGAC